MFCRKISIRLNYQNTFWNLHLDIISKFSWLTIFVCFLNRNIARSGSSLKMALPTKRSSCSMTVMLLRIMKSLKIFRAVCCCLKWSSWSILFLNTISSKAPMELNTESVIRILQINFSKKSYNDELYALLIGTRKRIHHWLVISFPSRRSTSST